ncbi:tyrosine-protein kinase transmembrane receptor Ror-like isoform X2 [Acropora palmata]|uniref:tyrosine-protein kinase transmembrane receptor Ror-like isoform X2 n=1 Tax=Acropora palmata TaxID=6131 RepID=UPI003DA0CA6D
MKSKYIILVLICGVSLQGFSSALQNNCSDTTAKLVSCGPPSSSPDQCLGWGCCWNSSSATNATRCYGIANNQTITTSSTKPTSVAMTTNKVKTTTHSFVSSTPSSSGTCQMYKGEICRPWLNVTMQEYSSSPRFIDDNYGLNGTDKIIFEFMKAIDRIEEKQKRCKRLLKVILCLYVLPPCNENNEREHYCREDCEAFFKDCTYAVREMLGVAKYILKEAGIEFTHIGVPDCSKLWFTEKYRSLNQTCLHWGLVVFTPSSTERSPSLPQQQSKANVIAGSVAVALFLLLFIVVTYCINNRRKQRKKHKINKGFAGVNFTAVSMRDRIRAESMRALDESNVLNLFNPDDITQLPLSTIEYVRDLGSGNFGLVFLGRAYGLVPGKEEVELLVAVKTLKEGSSTEVKEDFFKEVALMSLLHHENIVELLAVSTEEEPYGMIFEFMELGDLNQYLRKAGPFFEGEEKDKVTLTKDNLLSIALQCASGMEHLQALRFVHRDVATRNCLVRTGMVVKISDFGMSRDIYASDYYKVEGQALLPIRWMPPEALFLGKFTVESDVYSFGVLLWEIYALAMQPYYGYNNEEVVEFIKKGVNLGQPDDCPDHVYQVMRNCWHKDVSQRPTFPLIIAQLKQEAVSYDDPFDNVPESPVHDKQPLYLDIGVSHEVLGNDSPPDGNQSPLKISQPVSGADKSDVHASPSYMNINYNNGFRSDNEDVLLSSDLN